VARRCGATDFVVGGDWRDLAAGGIDVAFVCSPPLIWLEGAVEAIAAPVFADRRFGGKPLYASDVIVPSASPATRIQDLRGGRWAVNEPSSWSGYWVTLARVGEWSFFGEVVTAGFHQSAIRLVADGRVDGAAIDSQVLALELRRHAELRDRIRVVDSLGPSPSQPVVVRAGLATETKAEVRARLLGLGSANLRPFLFDGFAAAPSYGRIAAFLRGRASVGVDDADGVHESARQQQHGTRQHRDVK
jgi:ABC-type phosphate/phosphonate transport system substrate-binding protein